MEGSDGSPPQSLCIIKAAELFPKPQMEKEDTQLTVPFQELAGESAKYLGRSDDGILALSNYRIFLLKNSNNSETSVPLGLIESAQTRDLFHLIINCKDASTVKCSFETAEQCSDWQRRIQLSVGVPETLESLFAFPFHSWTCDGIANGIITQNSSGNGGSGGVNIENPLSSVCSPPDFSERLQRASRYDDDIMREVERLGFDLNGSWRISNANEDFKLCPSYPQKILVPCCIPDETLHTVANFRGSRRLPAVVWRHAKSGAIIARCSQPEVGWLGWRSAKDEQLLKALADACAFDRGEQMRRLAQTNSGQTTNPSGNSSPSSPDSSHEEVSLDEVKKVLIVDARSYTSAVTNRARGGGCECIEYYPCAEIEFMNLGNIHVIRKSFHALRQLCASPPDVLNWLGLLEKTMWLQHLSGLLAASMTVCHAIENKNRPVLVHCSDGWDRTPQIVATAELCLDPYYRTVEGFRVLVEREWLNYGHKFSDRCGHGPGSDELNERCPVFLQWLDLVHQIHKQFPCSFEFSMGYLIKLAQHSHSCLFGTFLCNTLKERIENSVFERTFSVWPFLSGPMYRNPLYVPNKEKVLWPAHNVRDLSLWTEVYLGSLGNQNSIDFPTSNVDGVHDPINTMTKTRSYGDLITAGIIQNGISRRSSDPNMTVDPNLTIGSNSENDSIADIQSEREDSPDIGANFIHDTTRKLQNLTIELNNHDEEDFRSFQQKIDNNEDNNISHEDIDETIKIFQQSQNQIQLHQHQQEQQHQQQQIILSSAAAAAVATNDINKFVDDTATITKSINNGSALFSSPQLNNLNQMGCEFQTTSSNAPTNITVPLAQQLFENVPIIASNTATTTTTTTKTTTMFMQNGVNGLLNTLNDGNGDVPLHNTEEITSSGVTIHKTCDINLDLMQSVDLRDSSCNAFNGFSAEQNNLDEQQNIWHGSITTSTDTLVPIENKQQNSTLNGKTNTTSNESYDTVDGEYATGSFDLPRDERKSTLNNSNSTNCSILPKVHTVSNNSRPNVLSNSSSNASVSSTSSSSNNLNKINYNVKGSLSNHNNNNNNNNYGTNHNNYDRNNMTSVPASFKVNPMEESILILPEHQKLEISVSGKCETILNNGSNFVNNTVSGSSNPSHSYAPFGNITAQRRRRTSSSNSRRDAFTAKQINGSTMSRFSIPGVRSLPMTPPGLPERPQINISCPDGLAHALSEQNIRLQQIVHEHKVREDVLLREIHDMRMALLKRICPSCNNASAMNDEQCSALDNVENASICSWEAVEDRSGPSSCTSSSMQPNATSVLWVPDHAVSRCTSCETAFWLGRRKHHCRSCGQIFCANCSEFWAPLPDEKLFSPVRLCGPCYHSVTTRMQVSQLQNYHALPHMQSTMSTSSQVSTATITTTTTAPTIATTSPPCLTMETCKQQIAVTTGVGGQHLQNQRGTTSSTATAMN